MNLALNEDMFSKASDPSKLLNNILVDLDKSKDLNNTNHNKL